MRIDILKNPLLIGIGGFARAGKSSMADVLEKELGYAQYSFAASIRRFTTQLCTEINPLFDLERDKNVPQEALSGKTPRQFMQLLGTEFGRNTIHPNFWVNHTMQRVAQARAAGFPVVISDVRFEGEAEAIIEAGGVIVWVHRPGIGPGEHASEKGLPVSLVHCTVINDSNLAQLRKATHGLELGLRTWVGLNDPPPDQIDMFDKEQQS